MSDELDGWTLVDELGQGGMGSVWRARRDDVEVALKVMHPHLARNEAARRRFQREVELGRRLEHPGLVRTLDHGIHDGVPWMAMEVVRGPTLQDLIDDRGALPEAEVRERLAEVAEALVALHDHGIVHRDVKPQNLILDEVAGRTRLMDLGIARADDRTALTSTGHFVGSTRYAAPEQFDPGRPSMDGRVDVYALGVVLYEMLTGQAAFAGLSVPALYLSKVRNVLPAPSGLVDGVSAEADALVAWFTSTRPGDRPVDARAAVVGLRTGRGAIVARAAPTWDELPPSNVPEPPNAAIGRTGQAHALAKTLEPGRLVTLMGVPGCGKTRLAIEVAAVARPAFPGGVVWVDGSPVDTGAAIAGRVAVALDLPVDGEATDRVGHALRARPATLLVLDNVEQVVDLAPVLAVWRALGTVALLTTSRKPTGARGEVLEIVEPLELPLRGASDLADIQRSPAVELFVQRARTVDPRFVLDEGNAATVARLIERLDGLPLAIELAAGRAAMLSPERLLKRLDRRFRLLRDRGATGRHAALEAALDASWELLSSDERACLGWTGVFAGAFDVDDVEEVWPLLEVFPDADDPMDVLQTLHRHSLVQRDGGDGVRFRLLQSIRDYVKQKVDAPDEAIPSMPGALGRDVLDEVQRRFGAHLAARASVDLARYETNETRSALDELAARFDDHLAVARSGVVGGVDCARAALAVMIWRGPLAALDELLPALDATDGELAFWIGRSHALRSELDRAEEAFTRAMAHEERRFDAQGFRGMVRLNRGAVDPAREDLQAVYDAAEAPLPARIRAASHLGRLWIGAGDLQSAETAFETALGWLANREGLRRLASAVRTNLGMLALRSGRIPSARASFEAALELDRAVGSVLGEGKVLTNLGIVAYHEGRPDEAIRSWKEALRCHRAVGNAESESAVLGNLGALLLERGMLAEARRYSEASVELKRTLGNPVAEAHGLAGLARVELLDGHYDRAIALATRAIGLPGEGAALAVRATAQALRGEAMAGLGRLAEALEELEAAGSLASRSGNAGVEVKTRARRVELLAQTGRVDEAEALLASWSPSEEPASVALVSTARGVVHLARGELDVAAQWLSRATDDTTELELGPGSAHGRALERLRQALASATSG